MRKAEAPIHLSVVMSAYNVEPWIDQAIESTLAQTYPYFEFLIVNDGSTDRTGAIIDEYAKRDSRIQAIHHENWGLCRSVNHAVDLAKHEWIVRMDADDVMLPTRFERQVAFIGANSDIAVAATLAYLIDRHGSPRWRVTTGMPDRESYLRYRRENRIMPIYQNSVIMRKSMFQAVGGHREEYWPCDDMDLWNRIADDDRNLMLIQPEQLVHYRIHESSISVRATQQQYLKMQWVLDSTARRRSGQTEQTFEEFVISRKSRSLRKRWDSWRELRAQVMYKNGTVLHINGKLGRAMLTLGVSLILHPSRGIEKVKPKIALLLKNRSLIERTHNK